MSEMMNNREYKLEKMKDMLKKLQEGEDVDRLKEEFKALLRSISPLEIPLLEQELVKSGVSPREIARMCDIHVELFRESVDGAGSPEGIPDGHPLNTLYSENEEIMKDAELLNLYASSLASAETEKTREELRGVVEDILKKLSGVGLTHYNREEMLLFPYIERRGISAVPTVLWAKHDEIRYKIKLLSQLLGEYENRDWKDYSAEVKKAAAELSTLLTDMVFRENNIFYPTMEALMSEGEWVAVKGQEHEYGYYNVQPGDEWHPSAKPEYPYQVDGTLDAEAILSLPKEVQDVMKGQVVEADDYDVVREGDIDLRTGFMSPEEIITVFRYMPVDITFIDAEDRVRFFSGGERVFGRSKSIIGRRVQMCHPPKSVYVVNKILSDFREGKRDVAEFWLQLGGRFLHIRYFAMRKDGKYIGTLEVSQDVTEIRKLEGEKRLLDY